MYDTLGELELRLGCPPFIKAPFYRFNGSLIQTSLSVSDLTKALVNSESEHY